jgi:hypothetical protein
MPVYTPKRYLALRIELGDLASRYDVFVEVNIRSSSSDSFYTKIVAEQGVEAAEAALQEWNKIRRMSDYALLVEPVARGMMALASVDCETETELVRLIDITRDSPFPHHYQLREGKMVVLINQGAPGCGCMQPRGSDVFAPWGRLGINAVVISFDDNDSAATELGVVLPVRGYDNIDPALRKSGFTVATVNLQGSIDADTFIPGEEDPDFMMKMLGLADGRIPRNMLSSGGHFDDAVGFPGATDYLANNLARLEQYFADLAERMSSKHKH